MSTSEERLRRNLAAAVGINTAHAPGAIQKAPTTPVGPPGGPFVPAFNMPPTVAAALPPERYTSPDGDLVYSTDAWSREVFDEQVDAGGALNGVVTEVTDQHQLLHREVFARLYGLGAKRLDPEAIDASVRAWAPKLHDEAAALPEWQEMATAADGDPMMCALATARVGAVLNEMLPKALPERRGELDAQQAAAEAIAKAQGGKPSKPIRDMLQRLDKQRGDIEAVTRAAEERVTKSMPLIRSKLRVAAGQAAEEIREMRAAGAVLGTLAGSEPGTAERVERNGALLRDARIRRILALAGRMRHETVMRRPRRGHGREELHSVELGADVERLLPAEVALLGAPMGPALLAGKLADRRAMQYSLRGRDKQTKGPILVAIDESGSMRGARDEWAKAVALSLMLHARDEGRSFGVVHFDAHVMRVDLFADARAATTAQLLGCVSYFTGGGTNIGAALATCASTIATRGMCTAGGDLREWPEGARADVVLISDGDDTVHDFNKPLDRLDLLNAAVYGVAIECDYGTALTRRLESVERITAEEMAAGSPPQAALKL